MRPDILHSTKTLALSASPTHSPCPNEMRVLGYRMHLVCLIPQCVERGVGTGARLCLGTAPHALAPRSLTPLQECSSLLAPMVLLQPLSVSGPCCLLDKRRQGKRAEVWYHDYM